LIRSRITLCLLLASVLSVVSLAQASGGPSADSSANAASKAGTNDAAADDRVIIKVGNTQVTEADFEARIKSVEGEKKEDENEQDLTEKGRRTMGDDYASVLMLSQQAVANHLDSTPEVSHELAIARLQVLSDAEFDLIKRQAEPKPEDITRYYTAHLSDYDEVQILRLFIWKRQADSKAGLTPEDARARANAILHASSGNDANKLAQAFKGSKDALLDSTPATFPRGELPEHLEKVAFAMKVGEWAEVEDTSNRIMLIQLVKSRRQDLPEVSSLIAQELQAQKMEAVLDEMKKNAGIWMDEKYFGTVAPVSGAKMHSTSPPPQLGKSEKTTKEEKKDDR